MKDRGQGTIEDQRSRLQQALDEGKDAAARKRDELMTRFEQDKSKEEPAA